MSEMKYPPLNPLRVRIRQEDDGSWAAHWHRGQHRKSVTGCETPEEAREELRKFVGMKVAQVDGEYVEVPRKPHWWWPR